jgi:hypothetical protein
MLLSGNGREGVRQACFKVQLRQQLPFAPSIIVFSGGKAEGCEWLGARELLVPPFTGEKTRQDPMIGLADQNKLIALFLNNHGTALLTAFELERTFKDNALQLGACGGRALLDVPHYAL